MLIDLENLSIDTDKGMVGILEGTSTGFIEYGEDETNFLKDLLTEYENLQLPSPEKLVIQKNMFDNLSGEAKELLILIFNTPVELITQITNKKKQNKMTMGDLRKYVYNTLNWKKSKWHKAKMELIHLTKRL